MAAAVLVLPFFVLLRSGTWLYGSGRLGTWPALAVGAALTFLLLAGYFLVAARWLRARFGAEVGVGGMGKGASDRSDGSRLRRRSAQGAAALVAAYCVYGLVFISGANAKTDAVRQEYRSLHPMLRLAVATLVLVDGDLLVTDASRAATDYEAMGLAPNERSLHLRQGDGYAHAVDLRTAGRSSVRNAVTRAYFAGLGFRTLRHVGTADHLHISLPPPSPR